MVKSRVTGTPPHGDVSIPVGSLFHLDTASVTTNVFKAQIENERPGPCLFIPKSPDSRVRLGWQCVSLSAILVMEPQYTAPVAQSFLLSRHGTIAQPAISTIIHSIFTDWSCRIVTLGYNSRSPAMAHVFFSYSHADEELRNELEKHLTGLRRQGVITTWHDRRIGPGEELHHHIDEQLTAADIVLLLVSADFLASDYCYGVEMKRAMERHRRSEAHVIPVILRPCDWHGAPFGTLMAVPPDGKPVVKHATLDDGFLEVAKAVRQAVGSAHPRVPTARASQTATGLDRLTPSGPRSSNLRVRSEFTDRDRHTFLTESFEYIARHFENSLSELQARNDRVESDFRRIDANRFEARAFVGGVERALCGIWLGGTYRVDGLYFSFSGVAGGSYNASMSVSDDGYALFLKPQGMAHYFMQQEDPALTMEGAAEYFWSLFIERLR